MVEKREITTRHISNPVTPVIWDNLGKVTRAIDFFPLCILVLTAKAGRYRL